MPNNTQPGQEPDTGAGPQTSFAYQLPVARNAFGLALFGLLSLLLAGLSISNREPLHLFTSLDFSVNQARLAYGLGAVAFLCCALASFVMMQVSRKGPVQLEFGAHSLKTPRASLRSEIIEIPYDKILKLVVHSIQRQQLLVLTSSMGPSRLSSLGFIDEASFRRFYITLTGKVARPDTDKPAGNAP